MTGIKKINLISAVLVSLSLCGGCTLEKAGNSSQDQTVQEDNETEQVKAEKAEKEEINEIHLRDKDSLYENDDDTSVVTMYLTGAVLTIIFGWELSALICSINK